MAENRRPRRAGSKPQLQRVGTNLPGDKVRSPIDDPTRTWDTPGIPNIGKPPLSGRSGTVRADLTREYVSAQPNQFYMNLARVLSFAIDDVTAEFGDDLYARMLFDPVVNDCIVTLKADVIEDGIDLQPAVTDKTKDGYDMSIQLVDDAKHMLDIYSGGNLDDWLWQASDGLWRGNTCSEITFRLDKSKSGRLQAFLDRLAVKPPHSYGYAVDSYKRILGIMGLIPGIGMPVLSGNVIIDPERQPNMLPRDKFAIYTHRPRDEDPRGTSILRSCYTPWSLKMQCLPEYAKWLKQFASPTLIGYTSPESQLLALTDSTGTPLQGLGGPIMAGLSPEQKMLDVLVNVQSGAAAVFPPESKVQPLEMKGMGNPFLFAFRWFNEEITMGTLGQPMTTMSQKYGTHALGRVQQDTQDTIVRQIKAGIARTFQRDVLRLWVRLNYGEEYLPFTPKPNLGQLEEPNLMQDLTAYAQVGYMLDPSQYPEVDKKIGMPPRTGNWMENALAAASPGSQSAQKPAAKEPQQPAAPAPKAPSRTLPSGRKRPQQATASAKMAEEEMADRVAKLKDHFATQRWREAVSMAEALEEETGIRLDPSAPPPTMERMQEMARDLISVP